MKIVIDGGELVTGKFTWELPESLRQQMNSVSKVLRNKMKLSEAKASEVEKAVYSDIQTLIAGFLNIVTAIHMMDGDGGSLARELLVLYLRDFLGSVEAINESGKKRVRRKVRKKNRRGRS